MNPKVLLACGLLTWAACLIQLGQGFGFDSLSLGAGGTLIAVSGGATTTWAAGPAILAGLLLAKVVGLGIFAVRLWYILAEI